MEQRLWEYIDGLSTEDEKASIQALLHSDASWRAKYDELQELNRFLASGELEEPSLRFGRNVMDEIMKHHIAPATKTYINKKVIYGLGGFFITMIAGLLIYIFFQLNFSGGEGSAFPVDISQLNWSGILNNTYMNVFLFINILSGLMLLDRYLTHKKEELKQKKI